ncbi:hypothetical protein ACFQVD_19550 [Streptosporangium amethystogenes subsp. fukuiense]|uniref:DUF306 domain-containing protein n=2 Tax=Streptosporangiaceae TaxID=2004 RepID=A0ABW2T1U1_9ACTN
MTHILLVAAFAAGLSACSAEDGSSASSTAPAVSASPTGSESTPAPAVTVTVTAEPSPPADSTDPPAEPGRDEQGDGAGDTGPAVYLLGPLGTSLGQPGWITVQTGDGDVQSVMLSPDAVVLDARGTICDTGKVPHRCTAAQLERALNARKPLNAKVMLQGGVAVRIEATTGK